MLDNIRASVDAKTKRHRTPRRTLEQAFRELDVDRNAVLSPDEFCQGVTPFLQGVSQEKLAALFRFIDGNQDGCLSMQEFVDTILGARPRANQNRRAPTHHKTAPPAPAVSASRTPSPAPFFNEDRPASAQPHSQLAKIGSRRVKPTRASTAEQRRRAVRNQQTIALLKDRIIERGGSTGIQSLARIMRIMDDSGDQKLSREELKYGLGDYGIRLSPEELDNLFRVFDTDQNGCISFSEFLVQLAEPMNGRRQQLVDDAFGRLDVTGDGRVTIEDIMQMYDASLAPEVVNGNLTEEQALRRFLDAFDSGVKDGVVTREEFRDYYQLISAAIDSDDYFELMMRNAWHMSGGEGVCTSTTCRRVLVTHMDGHQSIEEIHDDLGIAADDLGQMKLNLKRQGIDAKDIKTYGAFQQKENKASRKLPGRKASRKSRSQTSRAPFATDQPPLAGASSRRKKATTTTRIVSNDPSIEPRPSMQQVAPVLRRIRREIWQRAQGQKRTMDPYERMQHHATDLQQHLGVKALHAVMSRYGPGRDSKSLGLADFGHAMRAFGAEGQPALTDDNILSVWRFCDGGDRESTTATLFPTHRKPGAPIDDPMGLLPARPNVAKGPIDQFHFGERKVDPVPITALPIRMRYRYSKTPVQPPTDWDSSVASRSATAPQARLDLEWVYGHNGSKRANMHVSATGELLYHKAAVVVVQDRTAGTQRHYIGHDDDITCLCIDGSGTVAASGQLGRTPCVHVWDIATLETLAIVGAGFFERAVCAVAFASLDSRYIIGVGDDNHHMLGVWKWQLTQLELEGMRLHGRTGPEMSPGKLIAEAATQVGEPPQILGLVMQSRSAAARQRVPGENKLQRFTTVGHVHSKFWELNLGATIATGERPLASRNARYASIKRRMPRKTYCGDYLTSTIMATGASDGHVYIWDTTSGNCIQALEWKKPKGPVRSIESLLSASQGGVTSLLLGGSDGSVSEWRVSPASRGQKRFKIQQLAAFDIAATFRGQRKKARADRSSIITHNETRSLSFKSKTSARAANARARRPNGNIGTTATRPGSKGSRSQHAVIAIAADNLSDRSCRFFAATRRGDIWVADGPGSLVQLVHSHFAPLYGITAHPLDGKLFASVGEDREIVIWDAQAHRAVCSDRMPASGRSCCFSPDGKHLAVGCANGACLVYQVIQSRGAAGNIRLKLLNTFQHCVEFIDDIKYSPNGEYLAVASHDNFIDIHEARKGTFALLHRLKGHSSYITHIDWSRDSRVLQSNCGAYEIIYWNARTGKAIMSSTDSVEADTRWATWTCVLGFPVMGIWPEYTDGTDVNSVDLLEDRQLLVTGDDFGKVKLFNFPCVVHHAPAYEAAGHSSHVMNVRWLLGGKNVVSTGGWDAGVMQWKLVPLTRAESKPAKWKPLTAFRYS